MRIGWRLLMLAIAISLMAVVWPAAPAGASGGGGCGRPITEANGAVVRIKNFCFRPTVLNASVGETITWVNRDSFTHNVLGANGAWGSYEYVGPGKSVHYRFRTPGVYPYVCTFHPGMVGSVLVGKSVSGVTGETIDPTSVVPVTVRQPDAMTSAAPVAYTLAGGQPQPSPEVSGWQMATWVLALVLTAALTGLMRMWWRTRRQVDPEEARP